MCSGMGERGNMLVGECEERGFARRVIELRPGEAGGLAGLDFGDADRPVDTLFLHANGFNALTYRSVLEPLGASQHVLAIDQRGHGRTSLRGHTEARRSWDDLAADVVALLDTLDGPALTLAGHSIGGTASVLAARQRPKRVRRLVLFDPVILPWPVSLAVRFGFRARWLTSLRKLSDGALRRRPIFPSRAAALAAYRGRGAFKTWDAQQLADYIADGFRDRPDGAVELACRPEWESSNFLSHAHDVWGALRRVECPVDIFRAGTGSTCAVSAPLGSSMTVQTIPGTTHFLPLERPDLVRQALGRP
jgi:pimeloyl-ACP methyl ester carboxylesterase